MVDLSFAGADIFSYILPFLLVFSLSFAFLKSVIEDRSTRTVTSLILGALTLPLGPVISPFLSKLTGSFLIVVGLILFFVVMFEVIGVRFTKEVTVTDDKGNKSKAPIQVSIFDKFPGIFAVVLIAIAVLIFIQSGGLSLLGLSGGAGGLSFIDAPTVFFVAVMIIMVWWVSVSGKKN